MLKTKFEQLCRTKSDINEHLEALARYASECKHITEFGVRSWISDYAIAYGMSKDAKFIAYDIEDCPNFDNINALCKQAGKNYKFKKWDTREINIEDTDMLFIDTLHNYDLLKIELERHAPKVRRLILFHDTMTFGATWETPGHDWLNKAIHDYQIMHPERRTREVFTNNNGLTVIERDISTFSTSKKKTVDKWFPKITVYQTIYWWIDKLKKQPDQNIDVEWVCFTDDENLPCEPGAADQRDIRVIAPHKHLHPRMQAKYFRTHPYDYLDWDIVIYLDSTARLLKEDSIEHIVKEFLPKSDIMTFKHPLRNCIIDEMKFSIDVPKYKWLPLKEQVQFYLDKWFPRNYWLTATGMIVTRKSNYRIREFLNDWRKECLEWTYQDQLSLDYLVWKNRIKRQRIEDNLWHDCKYVSFNEPHLHNK